MDVRQKEVKTKKRADRNVRENDDEMMDAFYEKEPIYNFTGDVKSTDIRNPIYRVNYLYNRTGELPKGTDKRDVGKALLKAKRKRSSAITRLLSANEVNIAKKNKTDPIYSDSFDNVKIVLSKVEEILTGYEQQKAEAKAGRYKKPSLATFVRGLGESSVSLVEQYGYFFSGETPYLNVLALKKINVKQKISETITLPEFSFDEYISMIGSPCAMVGLYLYCATKAYKLKDSAVKINGRSYGEDNNSETTKFYDFENAYNDFNVNSAIYHVDEITSDNPVTAAVHSQTTDEKDEYQDVTQDDPNFYQRIFLNTVILFQNLNKNWIYYVGVGETSENRVSGLISQDVFTSTGVVEEERKGVKYVVLNYTADGPVKSLLAKVKFIRQPTNLEIAEGGNYVFNKFTEVQREREKKNQYLPYGSIEIKSTHTYSNVARIIAKSKGQMQFQVNYDPGFLRNNYSRVNLDESRDTMYGNERMFDAFLITDYVVLSKEPEIDSEIAGYCRDLFFFSSDIKALKTIWNKLKKICKLMMSSSYSVVTLKKMKKLATDMVEVADMIELLYSSPSFTNIIMPKIRTIADEYDYQLMVKFLDENLVDIGRAFLGFVENPTKGNFELIGRFAAGFLTKYRCGIVKKVNKFSLEYIGQLQRIRVLPNAKKIDDENKIVKIGRKGLENFKDVLLRAGGESMGEISRMKQEINELERISNWKGLMPVQQQTLSDLKLRLSIQESIFAGYELSISYIYGLMKDSKTYTAEEIYDGLMTNERAIFEKAISQGDITVEDEGGDGENMEMNAMDEDIPDSIEFDRPNVEGNLSTTITERLEKIKKPGAFKWIRTEDNIKKKKLNTK